LKRTSLFLITVIFSVLLFSSCTKVRSQTVDNSNDLTDVEIADVYSDITPVDEESVMVKKPKRIVAIGDIHGDLGALKRALRTAGAINESDEWIGKELVIVQTGDILDRGDDDLEVIELLEKLKIEAENAGGKIHTLSGNHELMNIQLNFNYATEASTRTFADKKGLTREEAFKPGGPFAMILSNYPAILKMDKMIFVHGGIKKEHVLYGIDKINNEYREWTKGNLALLNSYIEGGYGIFWMRDFSDEPDEVDCLALSESLEAAEAQVMIVGHSVQKSISSACDGKIWRIDTGMSAYYGGQLEVLEIIKDEFKPMSEKFTFKVISSK